MCVNTLPMFEFLACMTYTKRYFLSFDRSSFSWPWPNFAIILSKNIQSRENCKYKTLKVWRAWGTENRYGWSVGREEKSGKVVSQTTLTLGSKMRSLHFILKTLEGFTQDSHALWFTFCKITEAQGMVCSLQRKQRYKSGN